MKRLTFRIPEDLGAIVHEQAHAEARKRSGIDGRFSLNDYLLWCALREDWRELLERGKRELHAALGEHELNLVRDAGNGLNAILFGLDQPPSRLRAATRLYAEVEDAIRLNKADEHHGVDAWELLRKLNELPIHARLALVEDVLEFWAEARPAEGEAVAELEEGQD